MQILFRKAEGLKRVYEIRKLVPGDWNIHNREKKGDFKAGSFNLINNSRSKDEPHGTMHTDDDMLRSNLQLILEHRFKSGKPVAIGFEKGMPARQKEAIQREIDIMVRTLNVNKDQIVHWEHE